MAEEKNGGDEETVELRSKWIGIQEEKSDSEVLSLILENPAWIIQKRQTTKRGKTHLILSGEHGGVLSIPDSDHDMFMRAYCKDIACGIRHYFREEKTDIFPLAVDLDHKPKQVEDRWKKEHLFVWVHTFQTVLRNCYSVSDDTAKDLFLCLVTFRNGDFVYHQDPANHGLLRKKDYKQGYRLSFPNLLVSCETARTIRQCVIRELMSNGAHCRLMFRLAETDRIDESVCQQLVEILDESVYRTNGFRMIGSAKIAQSLCGKKKDPCRHCYKRPKFDIGAVYKFWTAVPGDKAGIDNQDARRALAQQYTTDIQQLIRACSVRVVPPKPETPGFQCVYNLSSFLLATPHGAQTLSTELKRTVVQTQRVIDPTNPADRPKYEALLHYFHETTFPDSFPYRRLTLHDIKSIHLKTATQTMTFTILLNTPFCAIKQQNHSTPKSYFVFHPKTGLRQKCHSETCKKIMDFFDMPRPSMELHHAFFPSDIAALPPPRQLTEVSETDEEGFERKSEAKVTIDEMMRNVAPYFSPSDFPSRHYLEAQVGVMRHVNNILQNRLQCFTQFRREVPHTNPALENLCDPAVLIKKHEQQQGTANHVFRVPGTRGRSVRGRGRGGSLTRKRARSPE